NNFTATVMEELVKKRLYRAYDERLIPYYLNRVRTQLSCENAATLSAGLESLHLRMLELRMEETDELESRLRRIDTPGRILDLLTATEPQ
ncbi:MAG: hypothetical protein WA952_07180, partial [Lewinella sp.]